MNRVFIIKRKHILLTTLLALLVLISLYSFSDSGRSIMTLGKASDAKERVIHMVVGEFSSTTKDGKEIEAYRWDPGTIYVKKGEHIQLRIFGVNGEHHPFIIEGMNINGEVKKGQETIVSFHAKKKGIYRLICTTHQTSAHDGPMIGYIIVD